MANPASATSPNQFVNNDGQKGQHYAGRKRFHPPTPTHQQQQPQQLHQHSNNLPKTNNGSPTRAAPHTQANSHLSSPKKITNHNNKDSIQKSGATSPPANPRRTIRKLNYNSVHTNNYNGVSSVPLSQPPPTMMAPTTATTTTTAISVLQSQPIQQQSTHSVAASASDSDVFNFNLDDVISTLPEEKNSFLDFSFNSDEIMNCLDEISVVM
eukprot:GEZU01025764.1.p1 GENE.GEZU01025764.1~~GEZU01025764.1.p1  ORF type:complete len:211 (+),score=71.60 GEZU01025764.1:482-1114(+)